MIRGRNSSGCRDFLVPPLFSGILFFCWFSCSTGYCWHPLPSALQGGGSRWEKLPPGPLEVTHARGQATSLTPPHRAVTSSLLGSQPMAPPTTGRSSDDRKNSCSVTVHLLGARCLSGIVPPDEPVSPFDHRWEQGCREVKEFAPGPTARKNSRIPTQVYATLEAYIP